MTDSNEYLAETAGGSLGAAASIAWFLTHNSISHYDSVAYEAKGIGLVLAGIITLGGLAHTIKGLAGIEQSGLLAEDIDGAGSYEDDSQ